MAASAAAFEAGDPRGVVRGAEASRFGRLAPRATGGRTGPGQTGQIAAERDLAVGVWRAWRWWRWASQKVPQNESHMCHSGFEGLVLTCLNLI